jgi:ATP-dependent RNA helicase RhlE
MSFKQLGLSAELLRAVVEQGYRHPTPIQRLAIPAILDGRDVMARAQTGTGKTAGFTLPLLQRLKQPSPRSAHRAVRTLILTPTRELAAQVRESVITYGRYLPLKSAAVFGGVGFRPQAELLRRGVQILVATPGRLLDHVAQRTVDLSKVEILVLDEADRMLDMGFIRDIRRILAKLPSTRQNLLFSATLSDEIQRLADDMLAFPNRIEVAASNPAADGVSHVVHPVDRSQKAALLSYLIASRGWKQILVFTRTKRGADRLTQKLKRDGIQAVAIHSDKSQTLRTRALADFKRGAVRVLVATDIAARGLDIDQLPHVVNFELPYVAEDYVHRIGRTGRAGNKGDAVSLVSVHERQLLNGIERLLALDVPEVVISGFEPNTSLAAEPRRSRNGGKMRSVRHGVKRYARGVGRRSRGGH